MMGPDSFVSDFEALAKLLSPQDADDQARAQRERDEPADSGSEAGGSGAAAGPGGQGPKELLPVKVAAPRGARVDALKAATAAEARRAAEEAQAWAEFERDDGREVPSHTIVYKQAVAASDAFLGMSGKDPSSACCEELVVRVPLPGAQGAAELDLDVQPMRLRLTSERYKLLLHLPRRVNADRGRARWDAAKRELTVIAPIVWVD